MTKQSEEENYLIGRQPILNRDEDLIAYELLFRSAASRTHAEFSDVTHASASVILNTLSGFGLEQMIGKNKAFINLDQKMLMGDAIELLPRERVVLELLESAVISPELITRCRELKEAGFTLALDDHSFNPIYKELYEIVHIIKIDLMQTPPERLDEMVKSFREYPVKLLAEKVETRDIYMQCHALGFEYFQGYYFAKPTLMEKKRIDEAGTILLKLIRLLLNDSEIEEIERAFRSSPGLTYKLLLLVNSVSLGFKEQIETVRHAIALLGRQRLKRWVQLALFVSEKQPGLENPLVELAGSRATFMEQLAIRHPQLKTNRNSPDQAFMIGILSLLEAIYHISLDEVVASLNLTYEFKEALLTKSGTLGAILELAELFERSFSKMTLEHFKKAGFSQDQVLDAIKKSQNWKTELA
ncbi:MAG: EAL domain-containing protein [Nitrospirae bacterium]|nr:EAL domain-containing protein [Nitrospirota bacterium]MBI3594967.1 EAL domain-containing protein [Nitrospirota bacterium]